MKKLLVGMTLLASMSSFANVNSYNVKGFTKLEYSKLANEIETETRSLENVKVLSLKYTIGNYLRAPYEFFGAHDAAENNDQDWLKLTFSAKINKTVETLSCDVTIFKDRETIALKDCMNDNVELSDDYIRIDFHSIGVERTQQRTIID